MLIGNFSRATVQTGRVYGAVNNPVAWKRLATLHNYYIPDDPGDTGQPYNSLPAGTEPPYALVLAPEGGELATSIYLSGDGEMSGTMILTRDLAANLSGAGDVAGSLSLLTTLAASLAGTGTLSGDLKLLLTLAATLSGTGDLSGDLKLRVNFDAMLSGSATLSADLKGIADLAANIYVNSGTATIEEIVDGVVDGLGTITATVPNLLNTESGDIIIPLD